MTDFQVRAYDEEGAAYGSTLLNCVPYTIELRISVLSEEDFKTWVTLKGGVGGAETAENKAKKFRLERQTTFSRRIYIGSCHDKGKD